ncbi:hypothetical protein [Vibrio algarum]|uniref:DUF2987 domain-containing protein n=1 Tax=Vibrio algarum TaxID=3020714 RepID=A0ABT4YV98_9VIBR|nr:hypothetical protein [Vibrio sp. KJ40-1]MDB1125512.1 hypothetical protein [Vibrio sp. KJ40-1]
MLTKTLTLCTITMALLFSVSIQAMAGASGEFIVGLGPIELGDVVMKSNCDDEVCNYETHIKGSFMFIGADIKEIGTYKQVDRQVIPVATQYAEKIGSKKKAFTYDFLTRKIEDKKNKREIDIPENVYPFMPLINQVILDLRAGGPRKYYEFLSKHKIKRANITAYTKTLTINGTLHHFLGKEKDDTLEFFFLEENGNIGLEKIAFGSFHMSRKQ